MELNKTNCAGMDLKLADLLLDPEAAPVEVTTHVTECADCHSELEDLRATMALLDGWEAPEPSPYFMTRMNARLREERSAPTPSWLERLRARLSFGPSMHVRPLAAMSLMVALVLGGGAYLGVTNWEQPTVAPGEAAVVHDLQTLDSNAQLLDQLESISDTDNQN
jgi:hypothetical protein